MVKATTAVATGESAMRASSMKKAAAKATRLKMKRGVECALLAAFGAMAKRLLAESSVRAKLDG
jgi:hypothetical protein